MTGTPPTFHHADAGTAESSWLACDRWEDVATLDVDALARRWARLLVVSGHPDDETLGVGALLATLADAGIAVEVVVASDGDRSHPLEDAAARAALGARRRHEVERAVGALAPSATVVHLGLPDGALAGHGAALAEAVRERSGPDTLVLAPWLADGHPDHDAVGRACVEAAAAVGAAVVHYPIWLWHWGTPADLPWPEVVAHEVSIASARRRSAALAEFPSQTTGWFVDAVTGEVEPPVVGDASLRRAHRLVEALVDPGGILPTVATDAVDDRVAARGATFDGMYDDGADPWSFESSFYEDRRRALLLAVLGRPRYARALEIGCADGRLTQELVGRCDEVVALDTSARAVEAARERVPGATVALGVAPGDLPDGPFDLVVLAEVGYFLTPLELLATLRRAEAALVPGGELVLCHWQHPTSQVPLDGALVHDQAATALRGTRRVAYADGDVRIDVWGDPDSVATREGRT